MIVEVERGINEELAHLRAGLPVAPEIPNFGFEKREPKVANGKEEFADQIEINKEIQENEETEDQRCITFRHCVNLLVGLLSICTARLANYKTAGSQIYWYLRAAYPNFVLTYRFGWAVHY